MSNKTVEGKPDPGDMLHMIATCMTYYTNQGGKDAEATVEFYDDLAEALMLEHMARKKNKKKWY